MLDQFLSAVGFFVLAVITPITLSYAAYLLTLIFYKEHTLLSEFKKQPTLFFKKGAPYARVAVASLMLSVAIIKAGYIIIAVLGDFPDVFDKFIYKVNQFIYVVGFLVIAVVLAIMLSYVTFVLTLISYKEYALLSEFKKNPKFFFTKSARYVKTVSASFLLSAVVIKACYAISAFVHAIFNGS